MWPNPFLAQRIGEERMKDALRAAEQVRLIRAAKNAGPACNPASRGLISRMRDLALSLVSVNHPPDPEPAEMPRFVHDQTL